MAGDWHSLYRDPRWQKKRLEVLERAEWCCQWCGESERELQVHHGYYEGNKKPWDYEPVALFALCEDCHEEAERARKLIKSAGLLPLDFQFHLANLIQMLTDSDAATSMQVSAVFEKICDLLVSDCKDGANK